VAYLRLGDDGLFFAEFMRPSPQSGQWLRITVPVGRLEICPHDEGSFTVREGRSARRHAGCGAPPGGTVQLRIAVGSESIPMRGISFSGAETFAAG
jgi:hypothetical protein